MDTLAILSKSLPYERLIRLETNGTLKLRPRCSKVLQHSYDSGRLKICPNTSNVYTLSRATSQLARE